MNFRVQESGDQLTAVFDGGESLENSLLSKFLIPDKYFVADILHDITLVERGFYQSHAFENPEVYIELFRDRITIEPYVGEEETEIPKIEMSLDSAKLLLFEWGAAVQRWRMNLKA